MQDQLEYLQLLEEKVKRQQGLPHLHGWKFYPWARKYFDSRAQMTFICSANQISKSSTQIRKHIHWATSPELWPTLWKTTPRQFWYLYPTRDVAHAEWLTKIKPEFMPRDEYKDHPKYGWRHEYYHNRIFAIHWNSGLTTFFKTYAQDTQDLQSGSVYRLDLDEECPEEHMSELFMRIAATDGYLSAVFTPTLGQEYWRLIIEERGKKEKFPDALKLQVSMFDCMQYEDGTPSHWTKEKIQRAINSCKSDQEVLRRVYGKFITGDNLKYPCFHPTHNRKKAHPIPKTWSIWVGVDIGSGGDQGHPSAITMVGVSPEWDKARVFNCWRGDGIITDAAYVVNKVIEMTEGLSNVNIYYDYGCRDFLTIAQRMNLHVEPANKNHEVGTQVLNVLFRNRMLYIYEDSENEELDKLANELKSIKTTTPKNKSFDDLADSLRYALALCPFNWEAIRSDVVMPVPKKKDTEQVLELKARRDRYEEADSNLITIEDELNYFNELMQPYE